MPYQIFKESEAMDRICDKDLIKELLGEFNQTPELNRDFYDKAIAKADFQELEELSHSLKGVSGNLSLEAIYKTATAMNNAVRQANLDEVNSLLPELMAEIQRFQEWLPEYLKS